MRGMLMLMCERQACTNQYPVEIDTQRGLFLKSVMDGWITELLPDKHASYFCSQICWAIERGAVRLVQ